MDLKGQMMEFYDHEERMKETKEHQREMKRLKLLTTVSDFETFVNRADIEILQLDIKVVEQSFCFQESFCAVVYYRELSEVMAKVFNTNEK
jgi:hypothetical protein